MNIEEREYEIEVRSLINKLCPDMSEEDRRAAEQRFKDYLDLLWDIYQETGGENFDNFDTSL